MPAPTRMTKLEAVNECLRAVGMVPVNTIASSQVYEVNVALQFVDDVLRTVLEAGWWFNVESEYEIAPDGQNRLAIPSNALRIDPADRHKRFVERYQDGSPYFYDLEEKSFTGFTEASYKFDVTWSYDFEEIPQAARQYVARRAAREFAERLAGADSVKETVRTAEAEALDRLVEADSAHGDYNVFHNYAAGEILGRTMTGHEVI